MKTRMVAIALLALALGAGSATAAAADTLIVDQTAGPYTTISDALADAVDFDTIDVHAGRYDEQLEVDGEGITIHGEPGTTIASPGTTGAPYVIGLNGDRDTLDGVTISGGAGGVRASGASWDTIANATITADDAALQIQGMGGAFVHHTLIRALAPTGTAVISRNDVRAFVRSDGAIQSSRFQADIVLSGSSGAAFDVRSGRAGEAQARGGIDIGIEASTVTGAPTAVSSGSDGQGGPVRVGAYRSIVHGSAPGLLSWTTETSASDAADFVDPLRLDFHLRADAPAAMVPTIRPPLDVINALFAGGPDTDFGGTPQAAANTPSVGAYVFVDRAPTATFTTSVPASQLTAGQPVTFDASGSADPDAALGGSIVKYVWYFGDSPQSVTTTTPVITHTFRFLRWEPTVILTTYDNNGVRSQNAAVRVHISDRTPPAITFSRPGDKTKLHRFRTTGSGRHRHKTIAVLRFSGNAADLGAGRPVMLTFRRTAPKVKATKKPAPCVYVSANGRAVVRACTKAPPTFPVQTKPGSVWGWASAKHVAFPPGTWTLTATATDQAGNVGTSVLHFTVT